MVRAGRVPYGSLRCLYPPVFAPLAPHRALAAGPSWALSPTWMVSSTAVNLSGASTSTGFDDIGEGTNGMASIR
jgi:hypothetical protein